MANQWVLKEDGYLNINVNVKNIVYHPILNVLLVITTANEVKVLDINSGVILKSSHLSSDDRSVICHYLGELDKIVFYDGMTLGVRSDYNGVLLLDTILQTPVQVSNENIKLELLVSEAVLFLQSLQNLDELGLDNTSEIINELLVKISNVQNNSKKGIKAQKWNTICLELPASTLKMVANNVMLQLKRLDKHIPTLPIASAINERLTNLMCSDNGFENDPGNPQRYLMYSEAARRKTFEQWPHMDYKWALPDQMAQAGFYHQPGSTGVDRAMCFTCDVCLVCWEKTDEPWGEHERHSPGCPFVKGEYTQNVPLSVTYATNPAVLAEGTIISNGTDVGDIICTGDAQGLVVLHNARNRLEEVDAFCLDSHPVFFESMLELKEGTMLQYRLNCLSTFKYSTGSSLLKTPPILLKAKYPEGPSDDQNDDNDDGFNLKSVTYKKCKPIGTKCFCGITVTDSSDKSKCGINFIVSYEILCTVRKSNPITKSNTNSITGGGTVSSSGSHPLKMHAKITSALDKPKPIHDSELMAKHDELQKLMVSEKILELQQIQQQKTNQMIQQLNLQQQQNSIPPPLPPYSHTFTQYLTYDEDLASDSGVNATGGSVKENVLQNTTISFDSNKLSKFIASDVKKMYKNMDYKKITSALPKKFVNHDDTNTMEFNSVFSPTTSTNANITNNNNNNNNSECLSAGIYRPDETHSIPVQLVKIKTFHETCYISDMIPTLDRQYIVVVIRKSVDNYNNFIGETFTGATTGSKKATTTTTNTNKNYDNYFTMATEPSSNDYVDVQEKLTDVTKMDVDDDDDYWCFSTAETADIVTASPNLKSAAVDGADIPLEKSEEEEIDQKYTSQIQVFAVDENGFIGNAPLGTRLFDNETEPMSICMLPNYMDNYNDEMVSNVDDFEASTNENLNILNEMNDNAFAMISANGSLNILSLLTLDTIACRQMDDIKYVSVIYCKNLERLCTYTENGLIHFYSYHDLDNDSNDGRNNNNINRNVDEKMNIAMSSDAGAHEATETDGLFQQQQEQEEFATGVANVMNDLKMQISPAPSSSNLITAGNINNDNNMGTTSIGGGGGGIAISRSGSDDGGNSRGTPSNIGSKYSTNLTGMIAYKNDLTTLDLKHMYALTLFDETLTPYSAEVPACWNELVQALKQRRTQHPGTGDDTHVSKTWRLHNDATTWDEHLIGITVGKNTTIGHIDFKFTLYQQCKNAPAIQITLLKQNTTGFGYRKKAPSVGSIYSENIESSSSVDDNVDFKIDPKQLMENPVLCNEYLNAQNAEIISGPIELSSCIDLSEQGGLVILTSPKLFKTRNRHFLIHIKTMVDPMKESQGKTRGCDWLHEMSITIRSSKNYSKLSYERVQRISMLESNVLLENLLKIVSQPEMNARKNIALDLLLWIISIRMTRYRTPKVSSARQRLAKQISSKAFASMSYVGGSGGGASVTSRVAKGVPSVNSDYIDIHGLQKDCVKIMEIYLKEFLKYSIVLGNRSTAHKCVKIVSVLADGIKNMAIERDGKLRFEECLKTAILHCFPFITQAKHAGALRWFTLLILGTTSKNSQGQIAETSIHLLFNVSKEIAKRKNRYTSLLQTRFGLHGLPFEPELFDSELALSTKYNVTPSTLTSILKNATNSMSANTVFDLKKMCATGGSEIRIFPSHIRRKGISNQLRGLLEVEPLHFTCFAASEATRVENLDLLQPSHSALNTIHLVDDIMVQPSPTLNAINKLINIGTSGGAHSNNINVSGNDGGKNNTNNKAETEVQIKFDMKNFLAAENMFYKSLKQKFSKNSAVKEETKALTAYSELFECAMKSKIQQLPNKKESSSTSTKPTNKHKGKLGDNKQKNADVQSAKVQPIFADALPWHKILSLPPKQTLIVDRMHSGARRFITLDFGSPIMLTDLVIPACEDLVLLFINIWCIDEETDGIQLILSSDIGVKTLVLSDLQPPPICRYLKITTTGRYGMSATRCKIPIGSFFGHVLVSEHDQYTDPLNQCITTKNVNIPMQLKALNALYEDVQCRYNLANTKLMELLDPYLNSEISNLSHMESYIKYNKENEDSNYNKIVNVYEECITFQHQLNMIQNVRQRLSAVNSDSVRKSDDEQQKKNEPSKSSSSTSKRSTKQQLSTIGVDKLRVLSECLVEIILHYIIEYGNKNISSIHTLFNFHSSCQLFDTLVVNGDTNMQLATCSLLVRMCSFQIWWGEFFSSTFIRLFSSQNCEIFPQDRVFFLLSYLGRKSISMGTRGATVIDAILRTLGIMLTTMIAPIIPNNLSRTSLIGSKIDLQLISWLLLFLSVCLDDGVDKKDQGLQRWDFMSGETDLSKSRSHSSSHSGRPFSRSFRKRFSQSKQNNYGIVEKMMQSKFSSQIEMVLKQQENLYKKNDSQLNHLQDLFFEINVKPQTSASSGGGGGGESGVGGSSGGAGGGSSSSSGSKHKFISTNEMSQGGGNSSSKIHHSINIDHCLNNINMNTNSNSSNTSTSTSASSTSQKSQLKQHLAGDQSDHPFDRALRTLKLQNTVIVIRGLITLMLEMDYTCNMDLFLLICKIIARLVSAYKPLIQLSKIITTTQLQQLLRMAVWKDQQQPWAVHAITCLLQDILNVDKNFPQNSNEDMLISDAVKDVIENDDHRINLEFTDLPEEYQQFNNLLNSDGKLPSLMECEDTEMDDILEERLESGVKAKLKRDNSSSNLAGLSSAMDTRLESGIDTNVEIYLRRVALMTSVDLFSSLTYPPIFSGISTDTLTNNNNTINNNINSNNNNNTANNNNKNSNMNQNQSMEFSGWPEQMSLLWSGPEYNQGFATNLMLSYVFDNIFTDLSRQDSWLGLEYVLQLWLTLNGELCETSHRNMISNEATKIPFGINAVQGLITALSWHQGIKLRCWCLGIKCLTLACNPYNNLFSYRNIAVALRDNQCISLTTIDNPNFEKMLLRFYSGIDMFPAGSDHRCAGPTVCELFRMLYECLMMKLETSDLTYVKKKLREMHLRVILTLVKPGGAIALQQGPIDAQIQLLNDIRITKFEASDVEMAFNIVENIVYLTHAEVINSEKVNCQKSGEINIYSNMFGHISGPETARRYKYNTSTSDNSIILNLLKLASTLIKITIPPDYNVMNTDEEVLMDSHMANESQTDEIKAAEIRGHPEKKKRTSCLADSILKNSTITTRLFDALLHCKQTSVVQIYSEMVNAKSGQLLPDPSNIDESIFKLLAILKCYTSKPIFVIKPLYEFLNAASDIINVLPRLLLSEPFLWFILYVLDSQEMLTVFTDLGGIKVLCQSLIKSNKTLINTQPGMVSLIMQYVNHKPSKHKSSSNVNSQNVCSGPSVGSNVTSNVMQNNIAAGGLIQSNDKKCPASSSSSFLTSAFKAPNEGLTNFAPYCSITSDNTTAQPADVLIMAQVASHRRARNAAWSYLYYATEQTIDLIITLPTAILLHEVQLQPHLPSLVACPSAVAIEISRDSSLPPIPIGNPISTGGLAIIRLKLAQPEIATNIVLRLYRPKDSASVGLTQIYILGTNVFNEIKSLEPFTDDESAIAKTSLAWLRVLGRCISVATFVKNNTLLKKVISTAASIPGFLEACCSLLNVVPISKTKTLQNLETVILKLGLFNKELGLELIDNLLNCTLPQTFRISNDCVSDLLFELCTTFDEFTQDRIAALIRWVSEMYNKPLYRSGSQYFGIYTNEQRTNPHSGFVNCLASILWTVNLKLPNDMKTLITKEFFNVIFKCSTVMQLNDPLKKATDALLCSICFIKPEMFTRLLLKMKILKLTRKSPIKPGALGNEARQEEVDDEDDYEDEEEVVVVGGLGAESMTDDTKQQSTTSAASINHQQMNSAIKIVDTKNLKITPTQLQTIAIACQSPIAIQQLIASSLPKSLAIIILRYCVNCCPLLQPKTEIKVGGVRCDIGGTSSSSSSSSSSPSTATPVTAPINILTDSDKVETSRKSYGRGDPMCNIETVASILNFFTETCAEGTMRDWLGSRDGSIFWNPLLYLLCSNRVSDPTSCDILCSIMVLESATIKFLSKVTACHPQNQEILTMILINAIKYSNENNGNYMMADPSSSSLSASAAAAAAAATTATSSPKTSSKSDGEPAIASPIQQNLPPNNNISGFTRRLVLQLLLESERILVSITCKLPVLKRDYQMGNVYHPSKRSNARQLLCYVSTHTKCREIIEQSVASKTYLNATLGKITPDGVNATASILLPNELDQPSGSSSSSSSTGQQSSNNECKRMHGIRYSNLELLSVAAGVTAKDKRLKEAKNQAAHKAMDLLHVLKLQKDDNFLLSASPSSVISNASHLSALFGSIYNVMQLQHDLCKHILLTPDTTMAQILSAVRKSGHSLSTPCITLHMINNVQPKSGEDDDGAYENGADYDALPSPLQIFSSHGGLALLARYLPTVYPDTPKSLQQFTEKDKNLSNDWVKIEQNDDIYEDVDDAPTDAAPKTPVITSVPQHSLAAFGLFLRLPAYSDILLQDKIKAQCLLRLVLGVTGDGEGNEIYNLALASSLPTLPFEVFKQLLDNTLLTSDDGIVLRRMCIEVGAIHLVLNCLGIFTHHSQIYQITEKIPLTQPNTPTKGSTGTNSTDEQILSDDKSHVYWAKGTGFGTGSIQQSWDVEQALLRQKSEEEHVTVLLQVLSSYINPNDALPVGGDCEPTECSDKSKQFDPIPKNGDLPPLFLHLLQKSCLIPALSSYLRNDSVLDITRHIPLYRAILELLRAISSSNQLVCLLSTHKKSDRVTSIASLLMNMKTCVDTYASRLKVNKKSNIKGQSQRVTVVFDDGDDEGLAFLIPDICETTALVQNATKIDQLANANNNNSSNFNNNNNDDGDISLEPPIILSIEQRYLDIMKALQFDTYEMIVECDNGYRFTVSHHFESVIRSAGERGHPARVKRLAQETVTLSTSLPLSYSSSVFVRCDNDRLDLMKVLITGPAETPYANGCFEFDVYFPPDYPNVPMLINLETTGRHSVRFNPNLYNDGKVCLSVLNTWHGRPEEKWNAQTSSFLQVLVSIQSLILVPEPYFNEPGFERSRGTPSGTHSSREYNSNIYQACVRWAMLEQIKNPSPCFKDIIHTHFWLKRHEVCQQIEEWISDLNKPQHSERSGRAITFNSMILRRQYRQLREELAKLPIPDGLEDLNQPFSATVVSPTTVQQKDDQQQLLLLAADDQTLLPTSITTPTIATTTKTKSKIKTKSKTSTSTSKTTTAQTNFNKLISDDIETDDDNDDNGDDDKTNNNNNNNNKNDLNQIPTNPKTNNETTNDNDQEGTTTSMNFEVNDSTPDSEVIYTIPSDIDPNDPLIIAINEI